jgi:dihydroflavonol-4-reductase
LGKVVKALVTGSNGFLGSHLVEELVTRGYEVSCLVRRTSNLRWLKGLSVRLVYGDVTSPESLREAVVGKDYVYHTAGIVSARSQWAFVRVNFHGTANLLEACWRHNRGVKKFVLVSSQSAGGPSRKGRPAVEDDPPNPVSRYGQSKLKAEAAARSYGNRFPVTIVRPPAIFGPRDYGMYPFFRMLRKGLVVLVTGERYASFAYVKDVVAGTILAGEKAESAGQTYYIAGERAYAWREFAEVAAREMGGRVAMISVPPAAVRAVGGFNSLIGAICGKAMMLDWHKAHEILQPYWECDISKARRELGYRPAYSLEQALAETIQWYEKEKWI